MKLSSLPFLLACATAALCACSATPGPTGPCTPDGTSKYVCLDENPAMLFQVNSCGVKSAVTKRCLNDERCITRASGTAFCGTGNEVFCEAEDDGSCSCPMPSPQVLGCNSAGSSDGPGETTLSQLDGCGRLQESVALTCQVGDRCWYTWKPDGSIDQLAGDHCASSIDPSQRSSPFYAMACDVEIYMHATTGLAMDCRCNRSNAAMQECRPGSDAWGQNLRLGTGPHIHGVNLAKWGGGFFHQGELYAPVHYTGGNAGAIKPGALYAINVANGNRRVVSGSYLNSSGVRVDVGGGHTVQGEALPFLMDAKLGADGMIYTLGSNTLTNVEITRINPANGDRTLIWKRQSLADASNPAFPYGQCFDGRVSINYPGGFEPVQYAERAFALGPNGTFFLGWNNDGVGVVQISADGATCTQVTRWASRNNTMPLPDIGTGVTPQYGTISGMMHRNGVVYAFTENVILAIDATTGNRSLFSNVGGIGGLGETNFFLDEPRDRFFACGTDASRKCSVHQLSDGNVAQGLFQIGQTQPVIVGKYPQLQGAKGALDNNNYNGNGAVTLDPADPNILYFLVLSGVIKYEIDTGNSHFISM